MIDTREELLFTEEELPDGWWVVPQHYQLLPPDADGSYWVRIYGVEAEIKFRDLAGLINASLAAGVAVTISGETLQPSPGHHGPATSHGKWVEVILPERATQGCPPLRIWQNSRVDVAIGQLMEVAA